MQIEWLYLIQIGTLHKTCKHRTDYSIMRRDNMLSYLACWLQGPWRNLFIHARYINNKFSTLLFLETLKNATFVVYKIQKSLRGKQGALKRRGEGSPPHIHTHTKLKRGKPRIARELIEEVHLRKKKEGCIWSVRIIKPIVTHVWY